MKIKRGDYLIAKQEQGKDYLFKALADNDSKSVEGVLEKDCHVQGLRHTMTVELSDVILNLGQKPHPGKVYGYDVGTVFYVRKTHDDFGDINFFYKPEKQVVKDLWESMSKVAEGLKRKGLTFLLHDVVYEVMPHHGEKYAGLFMKARNEKVLPRIKIRPEIMPATDYGYVWYHEFGHHLHLSFLHSKKLNAYWLKLYNTSIKVAAVKKDKSQQLLDALIAGEESPSDFKSGLDEEDALAYKWIIRTIQQVNGLSIKDLDTLFEADMKDEIEKVWPVRNIPRKELAPIISEYAATNVKELIAESFAFYMCKRKLPEKITKLVERSIAYAKANASKSPE